MKNPNSFTVALPVRQLPDGTVRVGHEPQPGSQEPFSFPVVPNEPAQPKASPESPSQKRVREGTDE